MRLSRSEQRRRRRARARALQALYAWDLRGASDPDRVAEHLWDHLAMDAEDRAIAAPLVHEVARASGEIDAELSQVTANWRLERLGAVERAVLRLGVAELRVGTTPSRVVIQEAVRLAERFGSPDSARFVNGVIDAVAHRMGRI